ncbi:MAG: hypothetical protein ABS36_11840, partial [Acidobacteria bacterium SCN 69-37]
MTRAAHRPFVLFAAAAGAEMGFGHLVRCGALADALGVSREIVLRGRASARTAALALGWSVHEGRDLVRTLQPDVVVVDDPSAPTRARRVRQARRAGVPVAVIVDAAPPAETRGADLVVDGSLVAQPGGWATRRAGPAWAILAPAVAARRRRPRARDRRRVLIALGGGAHVRRIGARIAAALVALSPHLHVDLAAGFGPAAGDPLPPGCRWIRARTGLADRLSSAGVAVVAGGVTLYEACALGTPAVAVPVVAAQRPAIAAAAAAGAVVDLRGRP